MRLKGERITIRLPEKDLRFIDSFIEQENENFPSRSELLRIAAKELIDRWIAQGRGRTGETLVFVANHHITAIDGLILRGEFKSREGALHEIIRNYLKSLEWDRIDEVEKRILEMRNKMAGMEKAEQFEKEIYER